MGTCLSQGEMRFEPQSRRVADGHDYQSLWFLETVNLKEARLMSLSSNTVLWFGQQVAIDRYRYLSNGNPVRYFWPEVTR